MQPENPYHNGKFNVNSNKHKVNHWTAIAWAADLLAICPVAGLGSNNEDGNKEDGLIIRVEEVFVLSQEESQRGKLCHCL